MISKNKEQKHNLKIINTISKNKEQKHNFKISIHGSDLQSRSIEITHR